MKSLFYGIVICLMTSWSANAQNPARILAPKYLPAGATTPIALPTFGAPDGTPETGYDGQVVQNVQNIQMDAQGNKILFFVVDEYIYDRQGHYFARMMNVNAEKADGVNELIVIPVPGNCHEFFLITSVSVENPSSSTDDREIVYGKIHIEYANNVLTSNSGFYTWDTGLGTYYFEQYIPQGIEGWMRPLSDWNISGGGTVAQITPTLTGAVTKIIGNNKRFLFLSGHDHLWRYTVTSAGITNGTTIYQYDSWNETNGSQESPMHRGEMEVVELKQTTAESPKYRLAYNFIKLNSTGGVPTYDGVLIVDLDPFGNVIAGSQKIQAYNIIGSPRPFVKGLEFSPSGKYLYVTHANNAPQYTNTIDQLNVSGPTVIRTALNEPGMSDFYNSQIELNLAGELYMVNGSRMAKILNPNDPWVSINWVNNAMNLGFAYNLSTIQLSIGGSAYYPGENETYALSDQIDGEDYSAHFFVGTDCCLSNSAYDKETYVATANGLWTPGNNPLTPTSTNTVYIKNELRIPAGKTVTIRHMVIKFAPGARVIVENGGGLGSQQGGRLILDNTTFTNDASCTNDVWQGVEVWGNAGLNQYSSSQGKLTMIENSSIQNAQIGALASQRITPSSFNFNDSRNGGIILATNSSFLNNSYGVYFRKYLPTSQPNNLSFFKNTVFDWIAMPNASIPYAHAFLSQVRGINFRGCDFSLNNSIFNTYSTYNTKGIYSINAQFYVNEQCPVAYPLGQACPTPDKGSFLNLMFGIYATQYDLTYYVYKTDFNNCQYGIYAIGADKAKMNSNIFRVREKAGLQAAGIAMYYCTGYMVQENTFEEFDNPTVTHGSGNSYGILVHNSGIYHNEIYKNTFSNLKIGGQSEAINGTGISTPYNSPIGGLQWICNTFISDIYKTDLGVNGIIDYQQGYLIPTTLQIAKARSAGNTFSLFNESNSQYPNHDIMATPGSAAFQYIYIDVNAQRPDNYSVGVVAIAPAQFNGGSITNASNMCPSKLGGTIVQMSDDLVLVDQDIVNVENQIESASGQQLEELQLELHYLKGEQRRLFGEVSSQYILGLDDDVTLSDYRNFLNDRYDEVARRDLIYLNIYENTQDNEPLRASLEDYLTSEELLFSNVLESLRTEESIEEAINLNPQLLTDLNYLASSTEDVITAAKAKNLLSMTGYSIEVMSFLPLDAPSKSMEQIIAGSENSLSSLVIYPNPTDGKLTFLSLDKENTFYKAEVYDLSGTIVAKEGFEETSKKEMSFSDLSAGIYVVKIYNSDGSIITKRFSLR